MHASDLDMLTPTEYPKMPKTLPACDPVNHPSHYETGGMECIDAMVETQGVVAVMDFCICNAFKYLWRHGRKNGIEDVQKAIWYLNKYIKLAESGKEKCETRNSQTSDYEF